MAYATTTEFRDYMSQVSAGAPIDAILTKILARATKIIDTELGYSFGTAAAGSQVVYGDGTDYLIPPVFVAASVTAVTAPSGYSVPDYIEQDGALVISRSGVIGRPYGIGSLYLYGVSYGYPFGWQAGVPYTVAATFGYAAVPADIVECCLEIAARIWRGKDAGFSDVVGVADGGGVGYNGKYPAMVKRVLDNYKRTQAGVW